MDLSEIRYLMSLCRCCESLAILHHPIHESDLYYFVGLICMVGKTLQVNLALFVFLVKECGHYSFDNVAMTITY